MLKREFFILLVCLLSTGLSYAQLPYIVQYADIQDELKEIWHDKKQEKTYLITTTRMCILQPGDFTCSSLGVGRNLMFHNQTYDRFNADPIFLGNYGAFYEIDDTTINPHSIEEAFPNAAIYKDGEDIWVAEYKIYKFSNGRIDTIPVIMNSEIPFWDIRRQSNGSMWFVNHSSGAYRIDKAGIQRRVSVLQGLPTNNLNCLHITAKDEIFVGYKGGISLIYDNAKVENFNLSSLIGNENVKEIESDNHGYIWFTTDKSLGRLKLSDKSIELVPTTKEEEFVIHTLEYNSNQDLMLIGTSNGLFISSSQGKYFHGNQPYADGQLYYFGDELLLSGKSDVRSFDAQLLNFQDSEYRSIEQAFETSEGDFWITDKKSVLLLDRNEKAVVKSFRKPTKSFNQIIELDDTVYLCHDKGIYIHENGKTKSIIGGVEAFYNVLSCANQIFAVSEQGIYEIVNGELQHKSIIEEEEKMLKSNKQFFIDDSSLLIPAVKSILSLDCSKDSIAFSYFPTVDFVHDFHFYQNKIYILHTDRLVIYEASAFKKNPYNPYCTIPVNASEGSTVFVDANERIWIQNSAGLAFIGKQQDKICNILKTERYDITEDKVESSTIIETKSMNPLLKWGLIGLFVLVILIAIFGTVLRQ